MGYVCCGCIRKGTPYGWKDRGIVARGRTGQRSLCVSRSSDQGLPPRPQGSELQGGRGPFPVGCMDPAGVKGQQGHSLGERGRLGPESAPRKPNAGPHRLLLPPTGSYQWAGPACPGPGSQQVNALCRHQGQEAANSFTEKGVGALGN